MSDKPSPVVFRPEVLQARGAIAHGPILLAHAASGWVLAVSSAVIALSVVSYLFLGTYTPRATVPGSLVPQGGTIKVQSPSPGVVVECQVREGQQVSRGDVLFVLADQRGHLGLDNRNTSVSDLRSQAMDARRASLVRARDALRSLSLQTETMLKNQLRRLEEEQVSTDEEADLHSQRLKAAINTLERHRSLAQSEFISPVALQEKEDQIAAVRAQVLAARRVVSQLARSAENTRGELAQLPAKTASQLAEIDTAMASLTQETADVQGKDRYAITASVDGTVTAINAVPGQFVSIQTLATLIPRHSDLVAHLFPTSRAFGFVEEGQKVRLRFQPYPFQKYGQYMGTVIEVSHGPVKDEGMESTMSVNRGAIYRVIVRLDSQHIVAYGRTIQLLPGTELEADIQQQSRRLIDWFLAPINSTRKHL